MRVSKYLGADRCIGAINRRRMAALVAVYEDAIVELVREHGVQPAEAAVRVTLHAGDEGVLVRDALPGAMKRLAQHLLADPSEAEPKPEPPRGPVHVGVTAASEDGQSWLVVHADEAHPYPFVVVNTHTGCIGRVNRMGNMLIWHSTRPGQLVLP